MMDDFYTDGARGDTLRLQLPLCDKTLMHEVAEDFSLPDYQPEIKRLLRVSATVQPPTHYVGGGSAEFSGTIDYCVLYAGGDGGVYCFATSGDYSFRLPLEAGADFDLSDGLVVFADCDAESVLGRVGGPRRINLKCRLAAHVKAFGNCVVARKQKGNLAPGGEEQKLYREEEVAVCALGTGEAFVLSEEIALEGEWRIVSGDAQVAVDDVRCGAGRVSARGEVILKLMLQREGEMTLPEIIWRKIPFEKDVPVEDVTPVSEAIVTGSCSELSLGMEEGRMLCDAEIILQAKAQTKERVSYLCDWYATDCESECGTGEIVSPAPVCCLNGRVTQSESRTSEELNLAKEAKIWDVSGAVQAERVACEQGRIVMTGVCRYVLLLSMPDGEMTSRELNLPLRYVAQAPVTPDMSLNEETVLRLLSAKARYDGARLSVDAEVGIHVKATTERTIRPVNSTVIGPEKERSDGRMTLCYPSREDTLWSVGKRYARSIDELVAANALQDEKRADDKDSLSGVKVLVV